MVVLVWSMTICFANACTSPVVLLTASVLDWISNMSLWAASVTKSAVCGATPKTEFTPDFSPIDWANAGPLSNKTDAAINEVIRMAISKISVR